VYTAPVIVLVNEASSAGSEIFAAALQDYGVAIVMGRITMGYGIIDSMYVVAGGRLKMPQSESIRVNGKSIQHAGVTPDILFQFPGSKASIVKREKELKYSIAPSSLKSILDKTSELTEHVDALRKASSARQSTYSDAQVVGLDGDLELLEAIETIKDWIERK
jgi:carboxyl-terminal processing protease